jgi:hypothetical protein
MQCPKCHEEMKSGSLEFEAPWWFGNLAARGRCCFWAEGVGRRELVRPPGKSAGVVLPSVPDAGGRGQTGVMERVR